jgi:preprotein translocase subunit YajC
MPAAATLVAVLAQGTDPAPVPEGGGLLKMVLMMGIIFGIFWFLIIRPQQKQEKARRAMLDALKKKDRVLTNGGLLGTVQDLRDDEVTLKVSENPDVRIRVRRSSVVEVLKETSAT